MPYKYKILIFPQGVLPIRYLLSVKIDMTLYYSLVFFSHENADEYKGHSGTNPHHRGNDDVIIVLYT